MKKLTVLLLYFLLFSCKHIVEPTAEGNEHTKITVLEQQLDSLKLINLDLQDELLRLKMDSTYAAQSLRYNEDSIKNSLKEQTKLIPKEAVLGGTMHFGWMKVLGNNWIIAQYDDGHVQGFSIYKYRARRDSGFSFELLDSVEEY